MPLLFTLLDKKSGHFHFPEGQLEQTEQLEKEFDDILGSFERGKLSPKDYFAQLQRILTVEPHFLDAHAHLAKYWLDKDKPNQALEVANAGLAIAHGAMPPKFKGVIDWGLVENRPYLRLLHNLIITYVQMERHHDAVATIDLLLLRNPNDNQGVRLLLGSELMRAGDDKRAVDVFKSEAGFYPPYFYELAFYYIKHEQWVSAATALRQGFAANPYIPEVLAGNQHPRRLKIFHGTNFAEEDLAISYAQLYGALWHHTPGSLEFMRWLFNRSKVMLERAALMECREILQWEADFNVRTRWVVRQTQLLAAISDELSSAIIIKQQNRRNEIPVWPWEAC